MTTQRPTGNTKNWINGGWMMVGLASGCVMALNRKPYLTWNVIFKDRLTICVLVVISWGGGKRSKQKMQQKGKSSGRSNQKRENQNQTAIKKKEMHKKVKTITLISQNNFWESLKLKGNSRKNTGRQQKTCHSVGIKQKICLYLQNKKERGCSLLSFWCALFQRNTFFRKVLNWCL